MGDLETLLEKVHDAEIKVPQKKAKEIDEAEAVQIINCMPETVDELRVFLAGGRKIIETAKLKAIVSLLNENRTLK